MNKALEIFLLLCFCSFLEYVKSDLGVFILVVSLGALGVQHIIKKKKGLEEIEKSKTKEKNGKRKNKTA